MKNMKINPLLSTMRLNSCALSRRNAKYRAWSLPSIFCIWGPSILLSSLISLTGLSKCSNSSCQPGTISSSYSYLSILSLLIDLFWLSRIEYLSYDNLVLSLDPSVSMDLRWSSLVLRHFLLQTNCVTYAEMKMKMSIATVYITWINTLSFSRF